MSQVAAEMLSVLVCHPEPLLAEAIAAAMEERYDGSRVMSTATLTGALAALGSSVDAAVIFDGCAEDLVDLFEAIRHRGANSPVVIATGRSDPERAALLLESGAAGVIAAHSATEELWDALRRVFRGKIVIDGAMRIDVLEALRSRRLRRSAAQRTLTRLSASDSMILRLLCEGWTVARIAERLYLSPFTVRGHVRSIGTVIGARGQLGIAATGRRLLAAARPPLRDDKAPVGIRKYSDRSL